MIRSLTTTKNIRLDSAVLKLAHIGGFGKTSFHLSALLRSDESGRNEEQLRSQIEKINSEKKDISSYFEEIGSSNAEIKEQTEFCDNSIQECAQNTSLFVHLRIRRDERYVEREIEEITRERMDHMDRSNEVGGDFDRARKVTELLLREETVKLDSIEHRAQLINSDNNNQVTTEQLESLNENLENCRQEYDNYAEYCNSMINEFTNNLESLSSLHSSLGSDSANGSSIGIGSSGGDSTSTVAESSNNNSSSNNTNSASKVSYDSMSNITNSGDNFSTNSENFKHEFD